MKRAMIVMIALLVSAVSVCAGSYQDDGPPRDKNILVKLKTQRLECWEKRRGQWYIVYSFRVSTGARDTPTPEGDFRVLRKITNGTSPSKDPIGLTMFFLEDAKNQKAIHGWNFDLTLKQWGWGSRQLGRVRITAGCVQLLRRNMRRVYDWAPIGTPVIIRR